FPHPSFFSSAPRAPRDLHSFPTRRSSDLLAAGPSTIALQPISVRPAQSSRRGKRLAISSPVYCATQPSESLNRRMATKCGSSPRSEEHTSELQSRENLVCRLLLEKKKQK